MGPPIVGTIRAVDATSSTGPAGSGDPGTDPALAAIDELITTGRYDEALRAVGELRRGRPRDPQLWARQARALAGAGYRSEAGAAARRWAELEPASLEARALADGLRVRPAEVPAAVVLDRAGVPAPARPSTVRPIGPVAAVLLLVVGLAAGAWLWWNPPGSLRAGFALASSVPNDREETQLGVPAEPPEHGGYVFHDRVDGRPVRWNPCRTIHYRLRLGNGPSNGEQLVRQGFDEITRVTGLRFTYDGPTDRVPQFGDRQARSLTGGSRDLEIDPVTVAFATADESDVWESAPSGASGFGGPVELTAADGRKEYVSGVVVVLVDPFTAPTFGPGNTYGNVLLHEMGHLVGLEHTDDPTQLMAPVLSPQNAAGLAAGDRRGLWLLGASQGC